MIRKREKTIKTLLLSLVKEIADEEFQHRVWIRGEGSEVSSIGELFCKFDDSLISEVSENYKRYELTKEQISLIEELYKRFDNYGSLIPNTPKDKIVLKDPRWHKIRKFAKKVYASLTKRTKS